MALHMVNNLLLADTLPRLMADLPAGLDTIILWTIFIVSGIAALILAVVHWEQIRCYFRQEKLEKWQWMRFWSSPCVLLFTASCLVDMVIVTLTCFV